MYRCPGNGTAGCDDRIHAKRRHVCAPAQAFRGELVPTEAGLAHREGRDYEPASVLPNRMRAAR
jgi:hypothetical protein